VSTNNRETCLSLVRTPMADSASTATTGTLQISGTQSMHLPFITIFAIFLVLKSDAYSLCKNIIVMQSQPMDVVLLS